MELTVNGKETTTTAEKLQSLLEEHNINIDDGGFAVAVNDTLITKNQLEEHDLNQGDHIEIIRATQGG